MGGICQQAQILILEILNVWMPVPLYLGGVVNPDMSELPSLILNPAVSGKHFETVSNSVIKARVSWSLSMAPPRRLQYIDKPTILIFLY